MGSVAAELQDCAMTDAGSDWQPLAAEQTGREFAVTRWRDGESPSQVIDTLAQEVPVALVYNGISHVVMLATPADLEDFAYGFSYTEGIISERSQIYGIDAKAIQQGGQLRGIELHIELASAQFAALKEQRRNLTGRTGCGLCGAESLEQVFKTPAQANIPVPALSLQVIDTAMAQLKTLQPLQQLTGATHACAIVNDQGQVLQVREDVGRHNALDKLIGSLLRRSGDLGELDFTKLWRQHWVLTTSRASYEMVQKVTMTGGRALVAISAPTALAVSLAQEYDFLLVGFARPGQCVVYHGALAELG